MRYGKTEQREWFEIHIYDETDMCIIWPYGTTGRGYGQLVIDRKVKTVPQLICEFRYGPRPSKNHVVAHGPCHNRLCINYRHLSWKTYRENSLDMKRDGTQIDISGEKHFGAKLTEEDIVNIRRMKISHTRSEISKIFNIHPRHVLDIWNRVYWQHVQDPEFKYLGKDLFPSY